VYAVAILWSWHLEPAVTIGLVGAALAYCWMIGTIRRKSSRQLGGETSCFMGGLAIIGIALLSPIGFYSDRLLSVHMVEHLLLTMAAPPLLLLGAPLTLALQAASPKTRKRVLVPLLHSGGARFLSNPLLGWGMFAAVLWGSHFSGLYELALENGAVHDLEHTVYLSSALLFWRPVVARDPVPGRLSGPGRLFYLFLSMPVTAFLGLTIYGTDRLLYPHYAYATWALRLSPIGDQHLAGAIMWVSGMIVMLPALALVLFDWLDREEREAERIDRRLAPAEGAADVGHPAPT